MIFFKKILATYNKITTIFYHRIYFFKKITNIRREGERTLLRCACVEGLNFFCILFCMLIFLLTVEAMFGKLAINQINSFRKKKKKK